MDNSQSIVTVNDSINNDSDCVYIINLVNGFTLYKHFMINAVNAFYSAFQMNFWNNGQHFFQYLCFDFLYKISAFVFMQFQSMFNFLIAHRV